MKTSLLIWTRRILFFGLLSLTFPPVQAQTSITSGGRIVRGSGTNMSNETFVIPLDGQQASLNSTTLTDDTTKTITPNMLNLQQNVNGNDLPNTTATPDLLVQHPKKLQS